MQLEQEVSCYNKDVTEAHSIAFLHKHVLFHSGTFILMYSLYKYVEKNYNPYKSKLSNKIQIFETGAKPRILLLLRNCRFSLIFEWEGVQLNYQYTPACRDSSILFQIHHVGITRVQVPVVS